MRRLRSIWPAVPPLPVEMPGTDRIFYHRARAQAYEDRARAQYLRLRTLTVIWAAVLVQEIVRAYT